MYDMTMHLVEKGDKRAVWMSDIDPESNSGAHMNSESFVRDNGSYTKIEDQTMPEVTEIPVDWAGADKNMM